MPFDDSQPFEVVDDNADFDPSKPFDVVGDSSDSSEFDPGKPFSVVQPKESESGDALRAPTRWETVKDNLSRIAPNLFSTERTPIGDKPYGLFPALYEASSTSPLQSIPRMETKPEDSTLKKVGAGALDFAQGTGEFLTSPQGLALSAVGAIGPIARRAIAAGFAPVMAKQAAEKLGEASVTKDPRAATEGVLLAATAGLAARHAAVGEKSPLTVEQMEKMVDDTIPQSTPQAEPAPPAQSQGEPNATEIQPEQTGVPAQREGIEESGTPTEASAGNSLPSETNVEPQNGEVAADPALKSMGGALYGENLGTPGSYVSNMFEAINQSRAEMGKPPMPDTNPRSWDQDNAHALSEMDRNPEWIPDLIKEVTERPRPLLSWENAGMVWQRAKWKAEANNALGRIAQAFDDGRTDDLSEARLDAARFEDKLDELDKAVGRNGTGSEAGRSLLAQKMASGEDFSLVEMRLRKRGANGGKPLTEAQDVEVAETHRKLVEAEKKVSELQEARKQDAVNAEIERIKRETPVERFHPKVLEAAERIVSGFEARADAARLRLREKLKTLGAGVDPTILLDVAEIGAGHLARKGLDFARWSKVMLDEFGDAVKPYLGEAFRRANALIEEGTKSANATVRKAIKKAATATEKIAATSQDISEKVKTGKRDEISHEVQRLSRSLVESGVSDREELIDAIHKVLKESIPEITRREAMDAISGYGDFKQLSKDQVSVQLRGMKGEMQQIGKIEDMQAKIAPKKSGLERRTPTDEERRLIQQVNELKKAGGFSVTDPATQLRSALESIKTRLRNQIKDLETQVESKQKTVKQNSPSPSDAEVVSLKSKRDALKAQFDEIFSSKITDEQRIQRASAALERSITEYDRRIKEKDFGARTSLTPESPALDALKAKRDATKAQFEELRALDDEYQSNKSGRALGVQKAALEKSIAEKEAALKAGNVESNGARVNRPAATSEIEALKQRRDALNKQASELRKQSRQPTEQQRISKEVERINKLISDRQAAIDSGDVSAKSSANVNRPQVEEIEKAKQQLEALNKKIAEIRKGSRLSREEISLKSYKTRIANRIDELTDKLNRGDFSKTPRRTIELDREAMGLKAGAEKVKHDFRQALNRDKYANRTKSERVMDTLVKWRRGFILSGPQTLAKLTSAAIARTITTPLEEVAGEVLHRALPALSKRAPRHGGGFNTKAEVKALSESVTAGMADAWQTLKTGKSQLDYLYKRGSDPGLPPTLIDVFGHIHGMLKAPVKRAEFARSFEKRMQWNAERGIDVSDEFVQARIGLEAFADAERSIFMQKNIVNDAYGRMLQRFEQPEKIEGKPNPEGKPSIGGKALATASRIALPVTKVPSNIVGEIMEYAVGSATGGLRAAKAYRNGIENLAPAEADLILRQLKKGSVGQAALLFGFFAPQIFGGFYRPGNKKKDAIKPDAMRVGGVNIDSHVLHNPMTETSQLGATIRQVADSKLRKKDKATQGISNGALAGALGLADATPFVREMTEIGKLIDPNSRQTWINEFVNSLVVPQALRTTAEHFDKDANGEVVKRKPTNVTQAIELGIPGLRKNVPKAKKR